MKTFKSILTLFIVAGFCSLNVMAQNNGKSSKETWGTETEPFCFWCPCANDGQGELLCGTLEVKVVKNSKTEHWNMKGKKLVGSETGQIYRFTRTETTRLQTGEIVLNVRTTGDNGLVTYWQLVGSYENETFFCR